MLHSFKSFSWNMFKWFRLGPAGRTKWSQCSDHHGPTPQDVPAVAFTGTTCSDYLTFQSLLLQSCVFGIYREIWMCRLKLQRVRIWICFSSLKAGGCPPPHHHALLAWLRRRSQQTSSFNFDVNSISSHYISLYTLLYIFQHVFTHLLRPDSWGPQFQAPSGSARLNIKWNQSPKILCAACPSNTLFGISEKATAHPQEFLQVCRRPPSDGLAEWNRRNREWNTRAVDDDEDDDNSDGNDDWIVRKDSKCG